MLLWFRTWRRKRLVARYEAQHGSSYAFHGVSVQVPAGVSVDLKNSLIKDKYETEERAFIDAFLPTDVDVIELGGSIGVISTFTRSRMAPDARQIVVEAIPALAEICASNISTQDTNSQSKVVQAAVSYSGAQTIQFMTGDNPHEGRIGTGAGTTLDVPVIQLEQLCADHGISDFALICDIEGAEIDLFAQSEIWKTGCRMIVLETHPGLYAGGIAEQQALVSQIKAAGFEQLDESRGVYAFGRQSTTG